MTTIKNEKLTIEIDPKGAQLVSVIDQNDQYEYLWQANPDVWNRSAPNLFPIVGQLKDGKYEFDGKEYKMGQHGFARDMEFEQVEDGKWSLVSTPETKEKYPFDFKYEVGYVLNDNTLTVSYSVTNTGSSDMFFSTGGHPAFNTAEGRAQIKANHDFEVYGLSDHLVDLDNQLKNMPTDFIPVSHEDFDKDAWIVNTDKDSQFTLLTGNGEHSVTLSSNSIYSGIWSSYPKLGAFVALEPWWGVADTTKTTGKLEEKWAIQKLAAGQSTTFKYDLTFA